VPCKKINFSQPERSRKKGRPRLSWIDSVLEDFKDLGGGGGGGGGGGRRRRRSHIYVYDYAFSRFPNKK